MKPVKAVILAAGKGTRLQSEQNHMPKVMRMAAGHPLLHYVLDALNFLPKDDTVIVAGYLREEVMKAFPDYPYAVQDPQQGTGHAVQCARAYLKDFDGTVLVCCGDMPLIRRETYESLLRAHAENGCTCTFLTGTSDQELPYGGSSGTKTANLSGSWKIRTALRSRRPSASSMRASTPLIVRSFWPVWSF